MSGVTPPPVREPWLLDKASRLISPAWIQWFQQRITQDSASADAVNVHVATADPHTQYLKETDHTKAAHDALNLDADTLDGFSSGDFAAASHNHDSAYVNEADHTKAAHDALGINADTVDGNHAADFAPATHDHGLATVPEYADNAAALVGGLTVGKLYRTGDVLKVVH
jgi:hypothetical protein